MDANILVISQGVQTSIQDRGRKGYRKYGVPIAGTMDKYSAILANKLLNNDENAPVMEITMVGPKLFFEDETVIVITGANLSPVINDTPIQMNTSYHIKTGDILSFGECISGVRAYMSVKGGFKTELKMGSYSYYDGITTSSTIHKGDRLPIENYSSEAEIASSKIKVNPKHFTKRHLEATKGPEFARLSKKDREILFKTRFEVDALNNRMGYQSKNSFFSIEKNEIITSAVIPGTVQLTPSGKLIIMMRDCPTTGGYPRILQLTDIAINQLAQKKEGDVFKIEIESSFSFLSRLIDGY